MEVVRKFVYFEVIFLTCISILREAVAQRCSVKKVFLEISQNSQENKITPWLTSHAKKTVSHDWQISAKVCVFLSLGPPMAY